MELQDKSGTENLAGLWKQRDYERGTRRGEQGEEKERREEWRVKREEQRQREMEKTVQGTRFFVSDFGSQLHKIWNGKCGFNHAYTLGHSFHSLLTISW